jgi:glycosyltransferase involved in cell wall biosynthesis
MHVLYFHQHFSTPKGATGIRSYEMAKHLIALGHQVTIVCGSLGAGKTGISEPFKNGKRQASVDGINVIELDLSYSNHDGFLKRSWTFVKFALASVMISLRLNYDLIFATSTPLTAALPGIFSRWLRRKPFVFEVRDLWPELPKAMGVITSPLILWLLKMLELASYRSAHRCIGLSPGIVDGIVSGGVTKERVELIPNGCDLSYFQENVVKWRPEFVSEGDFLAVFTGTHGIANGLIAIIDAAYELQISGRSDIKIALVGDGMQKQALQEKAAKLELQNLLFLSRVDKIKLAGLMASADVGLQCLANVPAFYYGTSPNKFFDYLAAGLPVLCNYPGWLAELINSHECGFVVPPDNPHAFAAALIKAADNRQETENMGKNALCLAKTEFDRRTLADKWTNWVLGTFDQIALKS